MNPRTTNSQEVKGIFTLNLCDASNLNMDNLEVCLRDCGCFFLHSQRVNKLLEMSPLRTCSALHGLPDHVKSGCDVSNSTGNRGYCAMESSKDGDVSELQVRHYAAFEFGVCTNNGNGQIEEIIQAPNNWVESTGLKPEITELSDCFREVADEVCLVLAKCLRIPIEDLKALTRRTCSQMRFLAYAAAKVNPPDQAALLGAHTDYELFTLLTQSRAGLQIYSKEKGWVLLHERRDAVIVMLGDMVHILSNGHLGACVHKVTPSSRSRKSVAFFFGPEATAEISPLKHFGECRVTPVVFGRHLAARTIENYPHLMERFRNGEINEVLNVGQGNTYKKERFTELGIG